MTGHGAIATLLSVQLNYSLVCDIRRGYAQAENFEQLTQLLAALLRKEEEGEIRILRVKDRFTYPSPGGWMDAMLNLVFTNDTSCHVCEIQVVLKDLMLARSQFGGHQVYGLGRLAAELLELAAVHSPWKNHIGLLCLQEFCKGYDTAGWLYGLERLGNGREITELGPREI